ncbi:dipeptidase PepE [Psychrosphaera aestuarii]|uniref:dipeptidase PepE n=1 Tax=Psychrosphaera aestuarii TaxID=1266052 RepID=UPI001B33F653|nr:dipeptidase PepE [Psychrosphaera aestuarii]
MTNALLLSASREGNTGYLEHAIPLIKAFLSQLTCSSTPKILFVPYAGVSVSYDDYFEMVKKALTSLPVEITSIHHYDDQKTAIRNSDIVLVGGGNTFALLDRLYQLDLILELQQQIDNGTAYIGWSAGSNIAGASIRTTNDMPIVEPKSFDALNILPFQINPHYTDYQAPGHNGETREMRLQEFMVLNPKTTVVGIQEGSALLLANGKLTLLGDKQAYEFKAGNKVTVESNHDFSYLLGTSI